jgi:hypothetical protein
MKHLLNRVIQRLGTNHHCRNTRLLIDAEKLPGRQAQVVVRMVDKCTGASYEATYEPETAERIIDELRARITWVTDRRHARPQDLPETTPPW